MTADSHVAWENRVKWIVGRTFVCYRGRL